MSAPKYGYLVVVSRSGVDGKAFPIHNNRVLIGRKETCDIRMQIPQVSKEHCVIRVVNDKVVLTNLSENCTSINADTLEAGQQRALSKGDVITIVGRSLRYEKSLTTSRVASAASTTGANPQPQAQKQEQRAVVLRTPQSAIPSRMIDRPLMRREPIAGAQSVGRAGNRVPRDPETARKFRLWEQHYSVKAKSEADGMESMDSNGSVSDILDESLPPGLLLDSSADSSMVGNNGVKPESDNPFDGPESDVSAFRSMADSVRNWNAGARRQNITQQQQQDRRLSTESSDLRDIESDDGVREEVTQIMEEISQMAHESRAHTPLASRARRNKSTANARESTPLSPTSTRVSGKQIQSVRTDRRRSRSLPRGLESAPNTRSGKSSSQKASSTEIPSEPLVRGVDSYGSEEETARATIGVSPTSPYSRSPTLEMQRRMEQARLTPVKRTAPPLYYGSLPRSARLSNSTRAASANANHTAQSPAMRTPTRKISRSGTATSSLSTGNGRKAGDSIPTKGLQLTSPLKRTLSCSGQSSGPLRSRAMVIRTVRPSMQATTNGSATARTAGEDAGESSDEIPTEPEPSSDSDVEESHRKQSPQQPTMPSQTPPAHPSIAAVAAVTPHMRQILLKDVSSTARKSVRFGPPLSPELFDAQAPPSTPIRRGTPMQIARMSSILRQQSESMLHSATPLPFHRGRRTGRIGKQPATVAVPRNRRLFRNHSSSNSSSGNGTDGNGAGVVDPSLLQSLLQPKRTRRHEMMEYLARLEDSNWNLGSPSEKAKQQPQHLRKERTEENLLLNSTAETSTGTDTDGAADRRLSQTGLLMDEIFDMEGASADIDEHQMSYSPLPMPLAENSDGNVPATPGSTLPSMSPMTRALVSAAEQSTANHTLLETITPKRLGRAIEESEPPEEKESALPEPEIVGIESPSTIGSPADRQRKRQRRRSLRSGDSVRRASMESPVFLPRNNDGSPSLVVQTRHRRLSNGIVPPPTPLFSDTSPSSKQQSEDSVQKTETASAHKDRKDRRRTAPQLGDGSLDGASASSTDAMGEIGASIAAMAAALGEDVPVMFGGKTKPAPKDDIADDSTEEQKNAREEQSEQEDWEPVPLSPSLALTTEQPLGLAEAMRMLESDGPLSDVEDGANSSDAGDAQESPLPLPSTGGDTTEDGEGANGAHRRRTIAGSGIPGHSTSDGNRLHLSRRSLGAPVSASELLLREQTELQSRLSANNSAESSMHTATASPPPSLGKRMRENSSSSSALRHQRRQTIALENIAFAENDQDNDKLQQEVEGRDEDGLEDDTADLLVRRQRLRRLQERRRRRQTVAELKRRRSSWRGWMPSASASPQVSGGDGGPVLQQLLSSPPQSPLLSSTTLDTAAGHVPSLPMDTRDSLPQPHVLPQPLTTDTDKSGDTAALASSPPALSLELQQQNHSRITGTIIATTTTPPASAMYPPPAWNLSAAPESNDAFSRSLPRTSDSDGRTLPKRRRITDYVTGALGLAKGNRRDSSLDGPFVDVELASATTSKTRKKEATEVEQPQYAYPPRPVPIDAGWEHVDASDILADAQSNIGNSAELDKSHLDETESAGIAATRLDGDEPTGMYDDNLSDIVVEISQQHHQAVELHAVSHKGDESSASPLLSSSADAREEKAEPQASTTSDDADTERDLPKREPDIRANADRASALNEQRDATLINVHRQSAAKANSATLLSPPRTRARATRNTQSSKNEISAEDPHRRSAATTRSSKLPSTSRELADLPSSEDVVQDSVVVGGHALRKQSVERDEQLNVKEAEPAKKPARRGRPPKKSQLKTAAAAVEKEVPKAEIVSPVRTRSGRKRKADSIEQPPQPPAAVPVVAAAPAAAPVKRGRGRPPKAAKVPAATTTSVETAPKTAPKAASKAASKPATRTAGRRGAKAAANALPISPPKTRTSKRTKRS
ncbi:antigen identified by monoclonal antibody Ki-67 [Coemansia guatemalensis]|uniref:Antigen identified by monoclonal antibody Ki-67 n=1 Tax=Coemansia guatemalensis TaxID=2761395 RepID=A0A9W8HXU5_9FUNG|nr:antigen identified by monoclonal antibody Ki-67 [Coemansia guatemalensis]